MVDDAFVVDLRARVNDPIKEHLLTSLKRHAQGSYTVAIWRVPRVGATDTSVLRKFPGRG
jgi:hypothetical protein